MLNDHDPGLFYKTIQIGAVETTQIPESMVKKPTSIPANKPDMQFFPEGGSLVTGIRSKVAFKAIGTNGFGINIKGIVVDNENQEVCTFTSSHLGMGYFYLSPKEGKTYKAKTTWPNGVQDIFDLPTPEASGVALTINNDSIPKASVRIEANAACFSQNRNKDYTLLIYSGGIATSITCKLDSEVVTMDILKRRLHTGIATVTLFSPGGEPLCERLLFIQNYDRLNLGISSDKTIYVKREKVNIKLAALNRAGAPAEGHFSVSVTDENKVPEDENKENTILSYLLLTADLKGYIEQPNYYFTDTSMIAAKNLDILMLTQGYRRFTWKQVLDNSDEPLAYQPEKGLEISGIVKSLFDKPIAGGTVNLVPAKRGPLLSSKSDNKGIFHFSNLIFNDTTHFVLSAVNAKGKNSTKITWFNEKPEAVMPANQFQNKQTVIDSSMTAYRENKKMQQDEFLKYGGIKGKMLKEVKIKGEKEPLQRSQSYVAEFAADQVIYGKDILYGGPLSIRLFGLLHGVHLGAGITNNITGAPMLAIIDGSPGKLDDVSTDEVETIEVLYPPNSFVYGHDGWGGVLVITTKPRTQAAEDIASIGILPITPMGFYKAREFYSPKYDNTTMVTKQRDLRSTIYWKPELTTDKNGNASFEYYNADGTGTYRVIIEGIDDMGNLGTQVYRYKVE